MGNLIGPDISFYNDDNETPRGIDFVKMRLSTEYVIIRAGQGQLEDSDFRDHWTRSKPAALYRGAYWFYDSRVEPKQQASKWVSTHGGDLGELPLWADFEESYGGQYTGWRHWKVFLEEVRRLVGPDKAMGIYTAYYYFKDNGPSDPVEREWFHQFELWIANYGNLVPAVPAPWEPNEWIFWQFQTNAMNTAGPMFGAESRGIDLNYFYGDSAEFHRRYGELPNVPPPTPPSDEIRPTHQGVTVTIAQRFGCKCVIHRFDLSTPSLRMYVTSGGFRTVGAAVALYGASGGFNGGGWPNVQSPGHRSNEIWVSDGAIKQSTALDDRGYINIDLDRIAQVSETDRLLPNLWNAWGFDRILGKNGVMNPKIANHTVKDARTGSGITANGNLLILSAEGNDQGNPPFGLTFPEMWSVLSEFGAVIAGNNDGGSSSTCINTALENGSLIYPSDGGKQSNVINQVLFFATPLTNPPPDPEPPGGTMDIYELQTPARPRSQPTMSTNDTAPNAPAGTQFQSDTIEQDQITPAGPQMVKAMSGQYTGKWFPLGMYKGSEYARKISTTPPTDPTPTVTHVIRVDSTGKISIDNGPWQ